MASKTIEGYRPGESVIFPSHGVGEIVGISKVDVGGVDVDMMVIKFEYERMTLRLPLDKIEESGLRHIASKNKMDNALKTLKGKSRNKPTMWARRAQEYENKINSGDPVAVAEVLRDLFRRDDQPEQSYSERQLYQSALGRLAHELAIVDHTDSDRATRRVEEMLGKVFDLVPSDEADGKPTTEAEKPVEAPAKAKPVEVKAKPKPVEAKPKAKVKAKPAVKAKVKAKIKAKAKVKSKPVVKAKKTAVKNKSARKA